MNTSQHLTGLASHLVYEGLLDPIIARQSYENAKKDDISFINFIVKNKILESEIIFHTCINTLGLAHFDLEHYDVTWLHESPIPLELIKRYRAIPLQQKNKSIFIGVSDPTDRSAIDAISFHLGYQVSIILVEEDKLSKWIEKHSKEHLIKNSLSLASEIHLEEDHYIIQENIVNYDEPLIRLTDNILQHAIDKHASDIHIEPYETFCRIRYRQDGILHEITEIPIQLSMRLISRLKILAKLDITDRRLPQDGRFKIGNQDFRINTCPTLFGEKIVLRLLNSKNFKRDLNQLGLSDHQLKILIETTNQPQGMILVTGPTGSGKTVTLYAALDYLNNTEKNISTIEDPIEIQLAGVNQVNIHPKIGLQFSTVLRTLLRQDPDVIMVGEIRDTETAELAIQASHTGHLVFSTLHTNSALDAITRLRSMGIANYHIANSISLIVAQRLVRKLCSYCKLQENISTTTLESLGFPKIENTLCIYRATGCQHCLQGYRDRIGIYEVLPISNILSHLISQNASLQDLNEAIKKELFVSLRQSGFEKILSGLTSILEINRVLQK
jgi:type IV pilus assembly protein PilB